MHPLCHRFNSFPNIACMLKKEEEKIVSILSNWMKTCLENLQFDLSEVCEKI